jgi:hypothetical protein
MIFVAYTSLYRPHLYQDTEKKLPWDTRGCYQRVGKQFLVCAKCGHNYIDWVRKEAIEERNKVLKRTFDKNLAVFNEKKKHKKKVQGLKKPTVEQHPLLIRCNCHKHFHSGYASTCPNQCGDGFCELCNCACSFVVSTTNYATVRIASSNAQKPTKSGSDVDDAREFLKVGTKVRKSAAGDAAEAYEKMLDDGKLEYDDKELGHAISRQASLITAQHYLDNPPAHGARAGLAAKMNMLAHPKGPMWVCRNGVDVNLGGSGSERRANNNGLTCIQEEPDDSDDVIQVVGVAKGSARDSGVVKIPAPLNWPFSAPSGCYPSPVEKMARRTRSRANAMMLDSSVDAHGRKKACTVRTALAKRDDSFLTIVEDMLPIASSSQDVLNACLTQASLEQTK